MGQWFTDFLNPLVPYEHQLAVAASIATILGIGLVSFFKPVRSAIASLWLRLLRATRRKTARVERADLRFVSLASQGFIAAIQGSNKSKADNDTQEDQANVEYNYSSEPKC